MAKYIDYQTLKAQLPFAIVLSHYGIKHSESRTQESISCPFHTDDKPSCSINKDKGIFRCFGCDASGNVLSFICRMQDLNEDDPEELNQAGLYAVENILGKSAKDFGRKRAQGRGAKNNPRPARKATSAQKPQEELVKENKPLTFTLQNLETDHEIFEERGLNGETVETFGLGICRKGMMKDRLVFPIHNANGELVAYSGRWLDDDPPKGEGKYKLPKGFNKSLELFNQHRAQALLEAQAEDELTPLVVVEGFWSAIRLHQEDIPAVATFGSDLSHEQALTIARMTEEVVIVFDGDEAGREGMARSAGILAPHVFLKTVILPDSEKPDTIDLAEIESAWE